MRNPLILLAAVTALAALPASAQADHRYASQRGDDCDRPIAASGFITVDNPNSAALEVLVDGQLVGAVAAGRTERFGPFEAGSHRVRTRYVCNRGSFRFPVSRDRVSVTPRYPARIRAPFVDAAVLALSNQWIEPMDVLIDGQHAGTIGAHGKLMMQAPRGAKVVFVGPHGERTLKARVRSGGLSTESLALIPPAQATVSIHNPLNGNLELVDARTGRVLCTLRPGQREQVVLPSGHAQLAVRFRGREIDSTRILADPWCNNAWMVSAPRTAPLRVKNNNRMDLAIYVGGRHLGTVAAGDRARLMDLPVGDVTVVARGTRGRREQAFNVYVDPLFGAKLNPVFSVADGRGHRGHGGYGSYDDRTASRGSDRGYSSRRGNRRSRGYASSR